MRKINILYYEPSSGFGGSSRCLRDWLQKLDRESFNPVVAVLDDGPVIKEIQESGDFVISLLRKKKSGLIFFPDLVLGKWNFLLYLFKRVLPVSIKLARIIRKYDIDIIHINTPIKTGLEGVVAARLTKIPSISHLHETRKWSRVEKLFSQWIDQFICLTDDGRELYRKYVPDSKLVRIYNGIEAEKIHFTTTKGNFRKEFNIDENEKIVGLVGRIAVGKGHDIFLRAAREVLSQNPETKFLIVGDTLTEEEKKYKKLLTSLIAELGVYNKVVFTGWRDDVLSVIANMDVLVQASTTFPEGFGLTCIEGMAIGVPLVVTNIPGPSELVIDGKTGIVVEPGNPVQMADAILSVLENENLAESFICAGRERVATYFDLAIIVKEIEGLYRRLC